MSDTRLVWIDAERCLGCGECVEVCPVGAIALVGDKARVDEELCTGCHACVDVCPQEAIHPVIEGEAVTVAQHPLPAVQVRTAPAETTSAPVVAIGVGLLTKAAGALARSLGRRLSGPSSKTGAAVDDSGPESRGTGGGGGRRARRRRRGQ
jgi:Fe-S-cluster-containing hydrogenase component 2